MANMRNVSPLISRCLHHSTILSSMQNRLWKGGGSCRLSSPLSLLMKRAALGVFYVVWVWPCTYPHCLESPPPSPRRSWLERGVQGSTYSVVCMPLSSSSINKPAFLLTHSVCLASTSSAECGVLQWQSLWSLRRPQWCEWFARMTLSCFLQRYHATLKTLCAMSSGHLQWPWKPFCWGNLADPPTPRSQAPCFDEDYFVFCVVQTKTMQTTSTNYATAILLWVL